MRACPRAGLSIFLGKCEAWPGSRPTSLSQKHLGTEGACLAPTVLLSQTPSQVKGRAVKIRPKTKDWLKGWQEEIVRKRDSTASMSPTANSCLLEENFDFTSLDYESEGE